MTTRKWGAEILVNSTLTGNQDQSTITALADGGFVIVWRDDGPSESLARFQRYDATGQLTGTEVTIFDPFSGGRENPAITQLNNGNLWIVGDTPNHDIRGTIETLRGGDVTGQALDTSPYFNSGSAAASVGSNGAVAVWRDNSPDESAGGEIYMGRIDASGALAFTRIQVDTGGSTASNSFAPDVAANAAGTRYAVVWTDIGSDSGDIHARVYAGEGTNITAELTINSVTADSQVAPKVAWLDKSRFVVTWTTSESLPARDGDGTAIHYAIYNESGIALSTERLANSTVAANQQGSAVTGLTDGGFAVAWEDYSATGADAAGSAIRLQLFDGVGDKRGSEILVNTTTEGGQSDISLTTLADGRIVVTWSDTSNGDSDIRCQIIDPRDGIVDGTGSGDTLYGHDAVGDIMSGGLGNDTFFGLAGNDQIYGGSGKDLANCGKGDDTAYGGVDSDTLRGGSGEDVLFGEAGADKLTGNAGNDTLSGGSGNDAFVYSGLDEIGDEIKDFSSSAPGNNDVLQFRAIAFGGLPAGMLGNARFQSSNADTAGTASVRFFYETDTGILRFDDDGSGAHGAVIIATLQAGAILTASDIEII